VSLTVCRDVGQCRKYKGSEKVRHRAEAVYRKFMKLFGVKDAEEFINVRERERDSFERLTV